MRKTHNSKNDHSKKVYVQPSIQEIGSISKQTKTNNNANSRDNASFGTVVEKGS